MSHRDGSRIIRDKLTPADAVQTPAGKRAIASALRTGGGGRDFYRGQPVFWGGTGELAGS